MVLQINVFQTARFFMLIFTPISKSTINYENGKNNRTINVSLDLVFHETWKKPRITDLINANIVILINDGICVELIIANIKEQSFRTMYLSIVKYAY